MFNQEIADRICERLAGGESLVTICADEGMPNRATVFRWLSAEETFRDMYARAREVQAEVLADEIVSLADKAPPLSDAVAQARLAIDARKWVAAKLLPRKYGERTTLAGDPDAPLQNVTVTYVGADKRDS
jgi:hypothetical protein